MVKARAVLQNVKTFVVFTMDYMESIIIRKVYLLWNSSLT